MKRLIEVFLILVFILAPISAYCWIDGNEDFAKGNYQIAIEKWRKLATQGNSEALYRLGQMYDGGIGVKRDDNKAVKFYTLAAEREYADAQFVLGVMYSMGVEIKEDYREALKWYMKAANQGLSKAQYNIGEMYHKGQGVTQDYIQAHKWYNIAGANGEEQGQKDRDILEKKMTPAQIEEAQKLAREWMEKHGKE